jgi:hypothetical protein
MVRRKPYQVCHPCAHWLPCGKAPETLIFLIFAPFSAMLDLPKAKSSSPPPCGTRASFSAIRESGGTSRAPVPGRLFRLD